MAMEPRPSKIVITDINEARVRRAREVLKPQNGVELEIVNTAEFEDTAKTLRERYTDGAGFDDVMIMAPVPSVAETADAVPEGDMSLAGLSLDTVERRAIEETLRQTGDNKSEAARRLGITRATLHNKLRKYGLE